MRSMVVAMAATLMGVGCGKNPTCCKTPDCSGGSDEIVGADAVQFRGRVPQNLMFLSIDTLRRDVMATHGGRDVTPFLDDLADESMVMMDHYQCANWTLGGMACALSGAYDVDRGHLPRLTGTDKNRLPIPQGTPLLASMLSDAGMHTAAVTSNSWFSDEWGIDQGYDKFNNPLGSGNVAGGRGQTSIRNLWKSRNDPWFMHLHFVEPHAAYDAPARFMPELDALDPWPANLGNKDTHYDERREWPDMSDADQELLEQHLRVRYDGNVRELDSILEETWTEFDDKCWLDDTLVVVWNDHGEAFWEHGRQTHAYNLTAEETDGVLMFWSKNIVPGEYTAPTSAIDLVPTLLSLYDLDIPPEVTGLPIGTAPEDRPIYLGALARLGGVQAVVQGGMKLHYNWEGARVRLWDRSVDPTEDDDLYDRQPKVAADLWDLLLPHVERMADLVIRGDPSPRWPSDLPAPPDEAR